MAAHRLQPAASGVIGPWQERQEVARRRCLTDSEAVDHLAEVTKDLEFMGSAALSDEIALGG